VIPLYFSGHTTPGRGIKNVRILHRELLQVGACLLAFMRSFMTSWGARHIPALYTARTLPNKQLYGRPYESSRVKANWLSRRQRRRGRPTLWLRSVAIRRRCSWTSPPRPELASLLQHHLTRCHAVNTQPSSTQYRPHASASVSFQSHIRLLTASDARTPPIFASTGCIGTINLS